MRLRPVVMITKTQIKFPLLSQILIAGLLVVTSASAATNKLEVNIKARFVELPPDSDWQQKFDWYPKTATNGSFAAVLTGSRFKEILQEIENRHGADLLSESQVTTLTGRQAQFADVEVQTIPTNTVGDGANNGSASQSKSAGLQNARITKKSDAETDPFGTTLDVVPSISDDGSTIQMNTIVTTTEFTGYESPEMPMYGDPPKLLQPHYRVRQFTDSRTIPDGATIALAGPSSTQTNNLLIFVTPTVIDASGNPIHSKDYYDDIPRGGRQ